MKNTITYRQWLQKKLGNAFKVTSATEDMIQIRIPTINNMKLTDWDPTNMMKLWKQYQKETGVDLKKKSLPLTAFLREHFNLDCYVDRRKDHFRMKPKHYSGLDSSRKIKKALAHVKGVEVKVVTLTTNAPMYITGARPENRKYKQLVILTTKRPSEIIIKPTKTK
jgi:hypothetical protein